MKNKKAVIAAAVVAAVFGAATWASPHIQLYRMRAAVEARDTRALVPYIDFSALQGSVTRLVMHRLGVDRMQDEASTNSLARFGQSMALAVIEPVVEAVVTPEGVRAMLETGDIRLQPGQAPAGPAPDQRPRDKVRYELAYRSLNQVVVQKEEEGGIAFVLDRDGLWSWKLVGIEQREE